MVQMLSLSRAARLAGVSRGAIQKQIRKGALPTFEGMVKVADLQQVYPDIELEDSAMLERLARLQRSAAGKYSATNLPSEDLLADEINRLRIQMTDLEAQVAAYQDTIIALDVKLQALQEGCNRKQKLMLQALITWMHNKTHQH